ncbi:TauD/TfdA family dioxygenase [Ferrovibrio sp.]|uniref:TauD/TfdA dioxygenase family protein n=1 Tax=Ferrovibrio sp. TaxID=1917215 RepID=UPI0025BFBA10|nr:TauD/TfdA family dioxygenase [Ferrovibrio sp.]MBX3453440.1 TauD/TfdA family dioxygenase [Ferrovibrio sp.]
MSIAATPLRNQIAAEIQGINFQQGLNDFSLASLLDHWHRFPVLVFRGQFLDDASLLSLSRRLGKLDPAPNFDTEKSHADGYPEVAVVSNIVAKDGRKLGGLGDGELSWHSDMTYVQDPPVACLLQAVEVPAEGGDTWFLDLRAAYEALPHDLKNRIGRLRLLHDAGYTSAGTARVGTRPGQGNWHPLVTTDPVSGRPCLLLGRRSNTQVEGLSASESADLLDTLWAHATQEQFILRHSWQPGDLLLWNNVCVMHRRDAFDPAARRLLHRTQVRRLFNVWERFASYA